MKKKNHILNFVAMYIAFATIVVSAIIIVATIVIRALV